MKLSIKIDMRDFYRMIDDITLTEREMLQIAGSGAKVQQNGQKMRVPVDTAATKNSIIAKPDEASATRVVMDIGAYTEYAPNIEYGRRDMPNYPIQPFVRPTVTEDHDQTVDAIEAAFKLVLNR